MRSYGQYCAVAKALDVIGDRWNLLIVRELMARGACRYTDLQSGLPGIATNLLADRLRDWFHQRRFLVGVSLFVLAAISLVPLVRLTGDLAKMAGYPAGVWWRVQRGVRSED